VTQPFKFQRHPERWKPPRPRWKNLWCGTCAMWIDREQIVKHTQAPRHRANAKHEGRAIRPERAA